MLGFLVFLIVLFCLLTPGILVSIPTSGSKYIVAATHAALFGLVFYFSYKTVTKMIEGFGDGGKDSHCRGPSNCFSGKCTNNKCE
jgi:hypothetical protein